MNDTNHAPLSESAATECFAPAGLDVWAAPTAHVTSMASAENHPFDGKFNNADTMTYCVS
jgi:hypothetical protein